MQKLTSVQKKALVKAGMEKALQEIVLAFATIVDSAEYLGHVILLGREEWGRKKFDDALKRRGAMGVVIDACVRVAKGEIDPRLVLCSESNDRYRNLSHYDLKTQKKILDKGMKVRVFDEKGKPDHRVMKIDEMTKEQVWQCLPAEGPRELEAQDAYVSSRKRAFERQPDLNREKQPWETHNEFVHRACIIAENDKKMEETKAKLEVTNDDSKEDKPEAAAKIEEPRPDWELKDGKLVVNNPSEFTQVELIGILGQLAKAATEVA